MSALSPLPYWKLPQLRFPSISGIQAIDQQVAGWRTREGGDEFATLLGGYVEHFYDVMEFGFQNGQFGDEAAVKLSIIRQMVFRLGHYLNWLYDHGHRDLRNAGPMWLSRYMTEFQRRPTYGYAINKFYRWAKTTNRFVPTLNFTRKHGKSARDHEAERFDVLTLEQAKATYERICAHPDPQGRFLAFMSLLYSQTITASSSLRRADLERNPESGCWIVKRGDDTGFELEPLFGIVDGSGRQVRVQALQRRPEARRENHLVVVRPFRGAAAGRKGLATPVRPAQVAEPVDAGKFEVVFGHACTCSAGSVTGTNRAASAVTASAFGMSPRAR